MGLSGFRSTKRSLRCTSGGQRFPMGRHNDSIPSDMLMTSEVSDRKESLPTISL